MNLAITGGFQHFQRTDKEDEVAASTLRPDLGFKSMVCLFLIKVSPAIFGFLGIGSENIVVV